MGDGEAVGILVLKQFKKKKLECRHTLQITVGLYRREVESFDNSDFYLR